MDFELGRAALGRSLRFCRLLPRLAVGRHVPAAVVVGGRTPEVELEELRCRIVLQYLRLRRRDGNEGLREMVYRHYIGMPVLVEVEVAAHKEKHDYVAVGSVDLELLDGVGLEALGVDNPVLDDLAVLRDDPVGIQVVKRRESVGVPDLRGLRLPIPRIDMDGLVGVLDLVGARVVIAVGGDEAVAVEVVVVRLVAEVAAVGEPLAALVGLPDGLVDEIPDEAALHRRILPHEIPVVLDVAVGVAHRVRVLAEDKRLLRAALHVLLDVPRMRVHRALDVAVVGILCALVLDRTRGVDRLHGVVLVLHRGAIACLVAKRPEDDRRMVAEHLDHVDAAVDDLVAVDRILGERALPLAVDACAMRLDVGLAHDIDALAVAELIPGRVVRVVRSTDGVDVEVVEDLDVLLHARERDGVAGLWLHFVAVGAHEESALAVDVENCVLDLDLAEAKRDGVGIAADLNGLVVHVGRLAAP